MPEVSPPEEMQESMKKLASALGQSDSDPTQLREVLTRVADFLQLNPAAARAGSTPLEFLMDVTVPMRAELGHAALPIGELLKLEAGSVIELDREVSQPVDLTVSGILFARGEVVVVEDHFAVRIKELVQPRGTRWPR